MWKLHVICLVYKKTRNNKLSILANLDFLYHFYDTA